MATNGEPATLQARIDGDVRTMDVTYLVLLAASVALVLAVGIPGLISLAHARSEQQAAIVETRGMVFDGRGTAPTDAEVFVRYLSSDGQTYERWMPVSSFRGYSMGTPVEVAYPVGQPAAAQVAAECGCTGADDLPLPLVAIAVFGGIAIGAGYQLYHRFGRATPATTDAMPARIWWAGPRSMLARLYVPEAAPGSGQTAGPMIATAMLPYAYRALLRDGDAVVLHASPKGSSYLSTSWGPLRRQFKLGKPSLATKPSGVLRSQNWLVSLGRSKDPIEANEGRRLDFADAIRFGLAPLVVLFWTGRLPAPWGMAMVFGLVPLVAGLVAMLWARTGAEDDLDAQAARAALVQQGVIDPMVLAPPIPAPASPELAGTRTSELFPSLSDDGRTPSESGRWFGSRLAIATAALCSIGAFAAAPGLLLVPVVAGAFYWRGSPRPVVRRYYRPGLPPFAGLAALAVSATCWYQAFDVDGEGTRTWVRAVALLIIIPAAIAAVRLCAAGVTVGRDEWVVRNVTSTSRFAAAEISAITLRPKRGPIPSAGLLVHRRTSEPVVVGRFTLSRIAAKRAVRDYDRAAILPPAPPAWIDQPQHPLAPSPYGRTF